MSTVTLSIGGRDFRVNCREGQEDQIRKLGDLIDDKVRQANVDKRSPAEMLLFASLLLADDVKDAQLGSAPGAEPGPLLNSIADRLESLASQLERGDTNP